MKAYLVEVDVHTLQLEVRRAIVSGHTVSNDKYLSYANRYVTYTPAPSRPCSPEMFCQKAAPIWLPCTYIINHVDTRTVVSRLDDTYALAGLEVDLSQ